MEKGFSVLHLIVQKNLTERTGELGNNNRFLILGNMKNAGQRRAVRTSIQPSSHIRIRTAICRLALIGIVTTIHQSGCAADAESTGMIWGRLPLPQGVDAWVDYAQAVDGELFLATETTLFVKSPYGDSLGWEAISTLKPNEQEKISAIGVCHGAGNSTVLVATNDRLLAVTWQRRAKTHPWSVFRYEFQVAELIGELPCCVEQISVAATESTQEFAVRAYLHLDDGTLWPLVNADGTLKPRMPISLSGAPNDIDIQWAAGPSGWSYAWNYATSRLRVLTPDGTAASDVLELADAVVPDPMFREKVRINCVWPDVARRQLFVGTNYGLAVAPLAENGGDVTERFQRIAALGHATIQHVGSTAGRLIVVTEKGDEVAGLRGPLLMEQARGRRCQTSDEMVRTSFMSPFRGEGPEGANHVVQFEDDMVFIQGERNVLWQWTPGRWQQLPESDSVLRDVTGLYVKSPWQMPVVMGDGLKQQLWYCRPSDEQGWFRSSASKTSPSSIRWLVPDTSGQGVWTIEDGTAAGVQHGMLEFVTPQGVLESADLGVEGGRGRVKTKFLELTTANGRSYWPTSQRGGLILPSGDNLIHADGGDQRVLTWSLPDEARLQDLLPGGESSLSAWLAILRTPNEHSAVVRVDVEEPAELNGQPAIRVDATELTVPATHEAVLFGDSDGHVWLADRRDAFSPWTGRRIHAAIDRPDEVRDLGITPAAERPVSLWMAPDLRPLPREDLLLTEHGCLHLPRHENPLGDGEGLRLLETDRRPPGAWQCLFSADLNPRPQVRCVIHSPGWARPSEFGHDLILLTSHSVHVGISGGSPLAAYQCDAKAPATSLKPVVSTSSVSAEGFAIVDWLTGSLLHPEMFVGTVSSVSPGNIQYKTWLELPRSQPGERTSRTIGLKPLQRATDAVSFPLTSVSQFPERRPLEFAVTDGTQVLFHRQPTPGSWGRWWTPFVPARLTFFDTAHGQQTFDVSSNLSMPDLKHTMSRAELILRPDYMSWWIDDFAMARLRPSPLASAIPFSSDGMASIDLDPGDNLQLSLGIDDPLDEPGLFPLAELPLTVPPAPPGLTAWTYVLGTLFSVFGAAALAVVSIGSWRRLAAMMFRGEVWNLWSQTCDGTIDVSDAGRAWTFTQENRTSDLSGTGTQPFVPSIWPQLPSEFSRLLTPVNASNNDASHSVKSLWLRFRIGTDVRPFLGSLRTTEGGQSIVVGLSVGGVDVPSRANLTNKLIVAVQPAGADPLEHMTLKQAKAIIRKKGCSFQRIGRPREKATTNNRSEIDTFLKSLEKSDVVVWGEPIQEQREGLAARLTEFQKSRKLRCRVLLLADCDFSTNQLNGSGTSTDLDTVISLARLGLCVVAMHEPMPICERRPFIEAFLWQLLPSTSVRESLSLASALDGANRLTKPNPTGPRQGITLFGNPSSVIGRTSRYDVFLCHATPDKPTAAWIDKRIRAWRYRLLGYRCRVFLDSERLNASDLTDNLKQSLASSRYLAVCCSRLAKDRPWVQLELEEFLRQRPRENVLLCEVGPRNDEGLQQHVKKVLGYLNGLNPRRLYFCDFVAGQPNEAHKKTACDDAESILASVFGKDRAEIKGRQRAALLIGAAVLLGIVTIWLSYQWWLSTEWGMRHTRIKQIITAVDEGDVVNNPYLISTAEALGRLNRRSDLELFCRHLKRPDWHAQVLAAGYLSLAVPDCDAARGLLQTVKTIESDDYRYSVLLLEKQGCSLEGLEHHPPDLTDDPDGLKATRWLQLLARAGLVDRARAEFRRLNDVIPQSELFEIEFAIGLASKQEFEISPQALSGIKANSRPDEVLWKLDPFLTELDWAGLLDQPIGKQLLSEVLAMVDESASPVGIDPRTNLQKLAAHLVAAGQSDRARQLLTITLSEMPEPSNSGNWAWRGLAALRLDDQLLATSSFQRAEVAAAALLEATRTWEEWFELARVYALAGKWTSAFNLADKPGDPIVKFQLKCYLIELNSQGPMNSSIRGAFPTN